MRRNRIDQDLVLAVTLEQIRPDDGMSALDLVVDGLADVVEKADTLGNTGSRPSSAAMTPMSRPTSIECWSMFWV